MMADFTSYEQIVMWLGKGKKKSEGRKTRALMLRMVNDVIIVSHARRQWKEGTRIPEWHLTDFAEIRSNNILTFTLDSKDMIPIAASVSMCLPATLALGWHRKGKGLYTVFPWEVDQRDYWAQFSGPHAYEHFKGMAWDLNIHRCFNPMKPILKTVDRDKRKDWVAALRRFNRAFNTRMKIGVLDQIIAEFDATRGDLPQFVPEDVPKLVLEAIKTGEVTTDFMQQIVRYRATKGWRPAVNRATVRSALTAIINGNSIQFRQEYGVLRK